MKVMDIHSHTYYSNCGRDEPRAIVQAAVNGGVEIFGISDHHYGIGQYTEEYLAEVEDMQKEFGSLIHIRKGVEISSLSRFDPPKDEFVQKTDYCLVEHLDILDETLAAEGLFSYLDHWCSLTHVGIAHTDIFSLASSYGMTEAELLRGLAQRNVFWELNVNYDSIHGWREHEYVKRFFETPSQWQAVREAGLTLSVGFDGHRVEDYRPDRLKYAARFMEEHGIAQVVV